jgi:hypothetical protein
MAHIPVRCMCSAHLILLDLIALIFSEGHKLLNFRLGNFLNPPVISSLVGLMPGIDVLRLG